MLGSGPWKRARSFGYEAIEQVLGHGYRELSEEVASHFRRVVPSGVLEVEKARAAVGAGQGIVKAEVGGGNAALGGVEICVRVMAGALARRNDALRQRYPVRMDALDQLSRGAVLIAGGVERAQALKS